MNEPCLFCDIANKKASARIVYEDDVCTAFLDSKPANPGHLILIPKKHVMIFPQLEKDEIIHIFATLKLLSNSLLKSLKLEGTSIFIANGIAAEQHATHLLIHIIPRKENDGINLLTNKTEFNENEYTELTEKLKEKWHAMFVENSKEQ